MAEILTLSNRQVLRPNGTTYEPPKKPARIETGREIHYPPVAFQDRINHVVGLNLYNEPNYRVVWGWSRLDWVCGEMSRYDKDGMFLRDERGCFREPKYSYLGDSGLHRWIIEKWQSAESYGSPETWAFQTQEIEGCYTTEALGPYPDRGDYELSFVVQDPISEDFVPLEADMCATIIQACELARRRDKARVREAAERELFQKEEAFKNDAGDLLDEGRCAFNGAANSTQANAPHTRL